MPPPATRLDSEATGSLLPARQPSETILRKSANEPRPRRRHHDRWLERWMSATADLDRLQRSHRMVDAVIDEVDGRQIRIGDHWLADFASCNYLAFDLDEEIVAAVPAYLERWGTHPSWSRLLGSPALYEEIEVQLAELLGAEDTLLLPTITHIHMSVIPVLAAAGTIFLDGRAHKTIYDGCMVARSYGADVKRFPHNDLTTLEGLLRRERHRPALICMDGVNSMTGNAPDVGAFARLAREHDAVLYIDDAHGFGVVGERAPDECCPYGKRGNGIVRHLDETYDNVILVGGFSKAYSSLLAFIACPSALKQVLKTAAAPYLYSGPSPVASLATALLGMSVNERRGDVLRADLHRMTQRVLNRLQQLGLSTPNSSGYPIVEVRLSDPGALDAVGEHLFERGIYVSMAAYPLVPREDVGFRIQVTSANTDAQVDRLSGVLGEVADRFNPAPRASG